MAVTYVEVVSDWLWCLSSSYFFFVIIDIRLFAFLKKRPNAGCLLT